MSVSPPSWTALTSPSRRDGARDAGQHGGYRLVWVKADATSWWCPGPGRDLGQHLGESGVGGDGLGRLSCLVGGHCKQQLRIGSF